MRNLRLNSRKLTTPFDIHETLKHFLNFANSTDYQAENERIPRGISLFKRIPANRTCEDAQIETHWCSCLNWIDINITASSSSPVQQADTSSQEVNSQPFENIQDDSYLLKNQTSGINSSEPLFLIKQKVNLDELRRIKFNLRSLVQTVKKIANRAVDFINSLIDHNLAIFCYRLRLHSVQKLSKLDLNRKLLAFKMSKDIHGREALFDDLDANKRNDSDLLAEFTSTTRKRADRVYDEARNLTNRTIETLTMNSSGKDSIYQIIFTTWPGNGTFELSFKYNRLSGEFKFNRNEISRINSYNSTSNCMINKRPDLRQYCFCKYI